jgi:hypothetical protein
MKAEPLESIGLPFICTLVFPAASGVLTESTSLDIWARPGGDSAQVDARVFAKACHPSIRLKDLLTCQVCHELLFDAVTVSPCCHHFCAPCLSQWLVSDNANAHSCPVCRVILSAATPDPLIRSISDAYAQVQPAHSRAPDEIRQLQQVDTSALARVGDRRRHAGEDDDEDDNDTGIFDDVMASWDENGGALNSSGMIRGPDAFALDLHAPFRPPTFTGGNERQPMRRTLQRWSELFSVEVDALNQLEEISVSSYLSDVWLAYIASFVACELSNNVQYIHLPVSRVVIPLVSDCSFSLLCSHLPFRIAGWGLPLLHCWVRPSA